MAVTLPSVYQDGTATIAANGTVVTGQGTLWTNAVLPGDYFGVHKGYAIRILSVDTDTQLTLANQWPGAAQTAAHYEIMLQSDNARMQETSRQLLQLLSGGNLTAFAGLSGAADALPYFTGAGAMATTTLTSFARTLLAGVSAAAMRTTLGLGTAAVQNIGTSGANVPLLSTANTWSGVNTFGSGTTGMNVLVNASAGTSAALFGQKAGSNRWAFILGNSTAEGGSNAGSDLALNRYDDSGAFLGSPISINRATGAVSLSSALPVASGGTGVTNIAAFKTALAYGTAANQNTGTSGANVPLMSTANTWSAVQTINANLGLTFDSTNATNRGMSFSTSGSVRWRLFVNNISEAGSNAGSNFVLNSYDDTGSFLATPVQINRATGVMTLSAPLPVASGGTGGATQSAARTGLGLGTAAVQDIGTSGATVPLLSTANTWTGTQTIGTGAGGATLLLNSLAATGNSYIEGRKGGVSRWQVFFGDTTAESGSNAGTNFRIRAMSDAGASLGDSIFINRADGIVQASKGLTTTTMTAGAVATNTVNGAPISEFRNKIINGNFDFWQRGTSQTSSGYGSADRWMFNLGTSSAHSVSRQSFSTGVTLIPGVPIYFAQVNVTASGDAAAGYSLMQQRVEGVRTIAGRTITLTFHVMATTALSVGWDIAQFFGTGGSPSSSVTAIGAEKLALAANTWTKVTRTITVPSASGKTLGTNGNDYSNIRIWFSAGTSNSGQSGGLTAQTGVFNIAHVSVVDGDATGETDPFGYRPQQVERALCHRYYWNDLPATAFNFPSYASGSVGTWSVAFPSPMRAVPALGINVASTTVSNCVAPTVGQATQYGFRLLSTSNAVNTNCNFVFGSGDYIAADAEL